MIGFKISLNNNILFTSAHPDSICLDASVTMDVSNTLLLSTFAAYKVETKEGSFEAKQAFWQAPRLKIEDEVSITIVEIDKPSSATAHLDYGVKHPLCFDGSIKNCDFCGEEETSNLVLFERSSGRICSSCVKHYSTVLEHNEGNNA
jgi:hypothetical protein